MSGVAFKHDLGEWRNRSGVAGAQAQGLQPGCMVSALNRTGTVDENGDMVSGIHETTPGRMLIGALLLAPLLLTELYFEFMAGARGWLAVPAALSVTLAVIVERWLFFAEAEHSVPATVVALNTPALAAGIVLFGLLVAQALTIWSLRRPEHRLPLLLGWGWWALAALVITLPLALLLLDHWPLERLGRLRAAYPGERHARPRPAAEAQHQLKQQVVQQLPPDGPHEFDVDQVLIPAHNLYWLQGKQQLALWG